MAGEQHIDAAHQAKVEALRAAIQVGINDMEAGRYKEFESFEELRRYLVRRTNQTLRRWKSSREK
ncbi:hypothetical protein VE25_15440 [Devosia geojensis]|uniref:CopG family transcriptional regulator n=1 Tax=Devosia geojensis TaxID=443610 RepID=A0A0F5FQ27_9HYPH|nr:hypothetical protein [Devosia geojensis]KKB10928.1 hypothetical protein VE25_15440 [Devosia geojensis]